MALPIAPDLQIRTSRLSNKDIRVLLQIAQATFNEMKEDIRIKLEDQNLLYSRGVDQDQLPAVYDRAILKNNHLLSATRVVPEDSTFHVVNPKIDRKIIHSLICILL